MGDRLVHSQHGRSVRPGDDGQPIVLTGPDHLLEESLRHLLPGHYRLVVEVAASLRERLVLDLYRRRPCSLEQLDGPA